MWFGTDVANLLKSAQIKINGDFSVMVHRWHNLVLQKDYRMWFNFDIIKPTNLEYKEFLKFLLHFTVAQR